MEARMLALQAQTLGSIPASIKPDKAHSCNPSTKEVEAVDHKLKVVFG